MRTWLCALAALAGASCVVHEALPPVSGMAMSDKPLVLKLPMMGSAQVFDLASQRGKVVLLDVWATWCEPCKEALPTYQALAQQYGARGLQVYALNVDADTKQIGSFLQSVKVTLPVLVDKDAAVAEKLLHVSVMPTTFIIDKRGVVRHVHEGFAEEFLMKYQTEIEALLAEKAP